MFPYPHHNSSCGHVTFAGHLLNVCNVTRRITVYHKRCVLKFGAKVQHFFKTFWGRVHFLVKIYHFALAHRRASCVRACLHDCNSRAKRPRKTRSRYTLAHRARANKCLCKKFLPIRKRKRERLSQAVRARL